MENIENLTRLEEAVEKLFGAVGEMRQEKEALKASLDGKEEEIEKLTRQIQELRAERSQVEKRVSGLLDSIEKWETLKGSSESGGPEEAATVEKTLF